jgi:hypothetical protein
VHKSSLAKNSRIGIFPEVLARKSLLGAAVLLIDFLLILFDPLQFCMAKGNAQVK